MKITNNIIVIFCILIFIIISNRFSAALIWILPNTKFTPSGCAIQDFIVLTLFGFLAIGFFIILFLNMYIIISKIVEMCMKLYKIIRRR